jgi:CheY-like chemotaxis protein
MSLLALVVDDSMLIRHTMRRFLENRGFAVETAADGAEALALLKTARPQLILTDLKMPNVDGHKLIQALSADPELSTVPVVILAAKPLPGESSEARANSVIYKDFNIETQLNRTLEALFPPSVS